MLPIKLTFLTPSPVPITLNKETENKKETLLSIAHKNNIFLEAACGGNLACSTCHVILDKKTYNNLNEPSDREYDLLEKAYKPTATSRLACQVGITEKICGAVVKVPKVTRNFAVDGYQPKLH